MSNISYAQVNAFLVTVKTLLLGAKKPGSFNRPNPVLITETTLSLIVCVICGINCQMNMWEQPS